MPQHKVNELLSFEEMEELRVFAREPGRSVDEVHEWLQARGFTMSRSSAGRWMQSYQLELTAERMSGAGAMARAFMEAARTEGGVQIPDAAVLQVSQMIFEQSARLQAGGEISTEDLANIALALQRTTLAKVRVEDVRSEIRRQQEQAVEAASKVASEGGSGVAVVDKVREILGIGGKPGRAA